MGADAPTTQSVPRVITVDKNAAYPKAIAHLKAAGILPASVELRQVKYLNNLIEQDHRFIKRLTEPGMGFFSFETAWRTLQGYEMMNMMRKGQVRGVSTGDIRRQITFIAHLFGVAAYFTCNRLRTTDAITATSRTATITTSGNQVGT